MSFNQFTNLDFNDLKTQIKDYLRTNSNFTDFDFEGSNFSVLIDLLAYNSYINSFNVNMAVNESYLDSATLRENVVSLARNIGYVPRSKRSAVAKISFTVDVSQFTQRPRFITLKAGPVALGSVINGGFIFSIPDDIIARVDNFGIASFNEIPIYEGVLLNKTFVMDDSDPSQKFILPNSGVDTTTIRVSVTDVTTEKYQLYENIYNVSPTSRLFLIQEVEDEKYQIIFGDNLIGKKPNNGSSIYVSYITTNGADGNGASKFTFSGSLVNDNGDSITSGISALSTVNPASNGDSIESIDAIKYFAPRVYSSQYRAVTANDYKGIIPFAFPNVERVVAYGGEELDPPEYGKVFIAIKPKRGFFISEIDKDDIKRKLKQYSIAGIQPEIVDLKYLYIELDVNAYYNSNYSQSVDQIKNKIYNTLNSYSISTDLNEVSGRFRYTRVTSLIDTSDIAITSNITKVRMRRDLEPKLNLFAIYELCFGNKFYVSKVKTTGDGYNIKSTGFSINGISNTTLYMSDRPTSSTSGEVFFFKIENGAPVKVNNPNDGTQVFGTVDYEKGEILLKPISFSGTGSLSNIQVQAIPDSNDILGKKDIYLQMDLSNSSVSMLPDTVASGQNLSGNDFITTSSYNNGSYIR